MGKRKQPTTRDLMFFLGLMNLSDDRVRNIRAGGEAVESEVLLLLELWGLTVFGDAKAWCNDKLQVLKEEHQDNCDAYLKETHRLRDRQQLLMQIEALREGMKGLHRLMFDLQQRTKVQHMQDLSAMRQSAMDDARRDGHAQRPIPALYEESIRSLEILRSAVKNRARVNRVGLRFVRESIKALARKINSIGDLVYKNRVNLKRPAIRRSASAGRAKL